MAKAPDYASKLEFAGFSEEEIGSGGDVRRVAEKGARRIANLCERFDALDLKMKVVHKKEKSEKYEIHGTVTDKGKRYFAQSVNLSLIFALDEVLDKLESELSKKKTKP